MLWSISLGWPSKRRVVVSDLLHGNFPFLVRLLSGGSALILKRYTGIQIHTGRLQQIAIKVFSLVYLHFGKLQSNTFNERIPKTSTD